jgi:hypothetical protein
LAGGAGLIVPDPMVLMAVHVREDGAGPQTGVAGAGTPTAPPEGVVAADRAPQPGGQAAVGVSPGPVAESEGTVAAQLQLEARSKDGKPIEPQVHGVSASPSKGGALALGTRLIDPVLFGTPNEIHRGETTEYKFYPLIDFARIAVGIFRTRGENDVDANRLPTGARANSWSMHHWSSRSSLGSHRLRVKGWNKDTRQEWVESDGTVTVKE